MQKRKATAKKPSAKKAPAKRKVTPAKSKAKKAAPKKKVKPVSTKKASVKKAAPKKKATKKSSSSGILTTKMRHRIESALTELENILRNLEAKAIKKMS